MEYDSLDRLITANGPWGKGTFTYDSQGNRTSKNIAGQIVSNTYTNNRMNGITHDANGNITNDGRLTYRYNSRNLITEVRSGDVLIESYKYDGLGRRIKRTENAGKVTYYLYQGFTNRVLSELNGKGKPTVNYVYMGDTRVARVNLDSMGKEASREYYVPDHLGSNIAMTDPTSVVAWDKAYLPYGDTYDNLFPNQTENIHDYTGKELDEDTGLHYYGARYYNAKLGRFMSVDEGPLDITFTQTLNRYAYVLNNPFSLIDQDGNACTKPPFSGALSANSCPFGRSGSIGGGSSSSGANQLALPPPPQRPALQSPRVKKNDTGFLGSRRFQLQNPAFQPVRNKPRIINNREFSAHALDQMQNRGFTPTTIENAIRSGISRSGQFPDTRVFIDDVNKFRVIVNSETGKVITIIPGVR